jgi:acyl-CoA thioesterase
VLTGRTGVYDVTVTDEKGQIVAVLRGRSHRTKDTKVVPL